MSPVAVSVDMSILKCLLAEFTPAELRTGYTYEQLDVLIGQR